MTYNKPEILTLSSSIKEIQGVSNKPFETTLDTLQGSPYFGQRVASIDAYEADE